MLSVGSPAYMLSNKCAKMTIYFSNRIYRERMQIRLPPCGILSGIIPKKSFAFRLLWSSNLQANCISGDRPDCGLRQRVADTVTSHSDNKSAECTFDSARPIHLRCARRVHATLISLPNLPPSWWCYALCSFFQKFKDVILFWLRKQSSLVPKVMRIKKFFICLMVFC